LQEETDSVATWGVDGGPERRRADRLSETGRLGSRVREIFLVLQGLYLTELAKRRARRWTLRDSSEFLPAGWYRMKHKIAWNRSARPASDLIGLRGRWPTPPKPFRLLLPMLLWLRLPPWIRLSRGTTARTPGSDARIVLFTPSHHIVILAPGAGWVRRINYESTGSDSPSPAQAGVGGPLALHRAHGSYDESYRDLRTTLSRYLTCTPFEIEQDGSVLLESYVSGRMLAGLEPSEQILRTRAVLERLIAIASEGSMHRGVRDLTEILLVDLSPESDPSSDLLARSIAERLGCCTDVPSHGDLTCNNIMIDGDAAYVIDWDAATLGVRPAWFDALHLLLGRKATPVIRAGALQGAFETELMRLWEVSDALGQASPFNGESMSRIRSLMESRPVHRVSRTDAAS
jgi:hypothetical protein